MIILQLIFPVTRCNRRALGLKSKGISDALDGAARSFEFCRGRRAVRRFESRRRRGLHDALNRAGGVRDTSNCAGGGLRDKDLRQGRRAGGI